ncbi:MAG TPA: DUF1800 domain-containing protein [Candidatus Baltobacteraceae bacterium]
MASSQTTSVDVGGLVRPTGRLDMAQALEPYAGTLDERSAAHLLRRAGFGGAPNDIARVAAMQPADAVESLVRFPSTSGLPAPTDLFDPIAYRQQLVQQARAGQGMFAGGARLTPDKRRELGKDVRQAERQSILALQRWWLDRMLATPAPLQEKMALYFHGHFTSAAIQKGVSPEMVFDQNQLFRQYALGNLRSLTRDISKDPAMLLYLDNAGSDAAHPNENYARELMELFTLGVDHYSETDVREAARAWTGWTVDRRTGQAAFVASRHDNGSKTFLGRTGNFTGDDIVDIIFDQPQCATFFATSLLNYFVYNNPEPELVAAVAASLRKHDYEIAPVVSMLLRSNVFYSDRAYRALIKSPAEFVVGTYKSLGLAQVDGIGLRAMRAMGQILFYPPNVAGWPPGANWMTSQMLISRQNFVAALVNEPAVGETAWVAALPDDAAKASHDLVATLLQGDASKQSFVQLASYLDGTNTSALGALSTENRDERLRGAAYLTMAMPAYQLN